MRNPVVIIMLIVFLCQGVLAEPELKGTASELSQYLAEAPKITILTSTSELKVPADSAILRIRVMTESGTLEKAIKLNQDMRVTLENRLAAKGISKDRIQASSFSTTPEYGLFGKKPKSYNVKNFIKITINNDNEFREASKVVDEYKEVDYIGVELEHSDKEAMKLQALRKACENNMKKKNIFEETFGVALAVKSFQTHGGLASVASESPESLYRRRQLQGKDTLNVSSGFYSGKEITAFGELIFTANVTVQYLVDSPKAENR